MSWSARRAVVMLAIVVFVAGCGDSAFEPDSPPTTSPSAQSEYKQNADGLLASLHKAGWPNARIATHKDADYILEPGKESPRSIVEVDVSPGKGEVVRCQVLMVHTGGGYVAHDGTKPKPISHKVARINGKPLVDFANADSINVEAAGLTKVGISRKDLQKALKVLIERRALKCT